MNSTNLKSSVINECKLWQEKFVELSKNVTQSNITSVYEYLKHSSIVKSQSNTLVEVQEHLENYNKLCLEIEDKKKKTVSEKYDTVADLQ